MRTRNRNQEVEEHAQGNGNADAPRDGVGDDLRNRARRLLELGDQTIRHALSQNSEQFLQQNRQQGGQ